MERVNFTSPELDLAAESKRARRKQKRRRRHDAARDLDESNGVNTSLARFDPQLIADLLAKQTRRFQPDLSTPEAEELRVPGPHPILCPNLERQY